MLIYSVVVIDCFIGERLGTSEKRAWYSLGIVVLIVGVRWCDVLLLFSCRLYRLYLRTYDCYCGWLTLSSDPCFLQYGVIAAILLLNPETPCQPAVGGSGC